MPSIILISSIRLKTGEDSDPVVFTPVGSDALILRLSTTQVGLKASQATLYVRSDDGRNLGSVLCDDGEDKRLTVDGQPDGPITVQVVCNLGEVIADVAELTGLDAAVPEADKTSGVVAATKPDFLLAVGAGSIDPPETQSVPTGTRINLATTKASRGSSIVNLGGGQFQLAAGKTYKLTSFINAGSGGGNIDVALFSWHDQTAGSPGVEIPTGALARIVDGSSATSASHAGTAVAFVTPSAAPVVVALVVTQAFDAPNVNLTTSTILVEEV